MQRAPLALILAFIGCADPTATMWRSVAPPTVGLDQRNNSYSIDAAGRTMYVTVVQVRGETGEPLHAFLRRMFESADSANAQRMVLDLRAITGGDARLLAPLLGGIARRDTFVRDGGLYVMTGSESFSPAQNAATLLQRFAHPVFLR